MKSTFNFKRSIIFFLFLCASLPYNTLYSQGNTCATATSISSNNSCVYTAGTTAGATYQSNANNGGTPSCASPGAPDVWYSFTPGASGTYVISTSAGSITDGGMSIYSGACGSMTELSCSDDDGPGSMPEISVPLTSGTTYYIRVWNYGGSGTGTFSICITNPPPAPANDNCSGATAFPAIPTNGTCSNLNNQSNAGSTNSNVTPTGYCTSNSGTPTNDVWYSFVATTTGVTLSATNVSGLTDVYWQIFSGACASSMTSLLCTDTDAGGSVSGLTIGNTYYVRMYTYFTGTTVQNICLSGFTPPTNDNCSGATAFPAIPTNGSCSTLSNQSNANSTNSNVTPTGACTSNAGTPTNDVWFSFVATAATINLAATNVSGVTDVYWQVFSGACASSMTSLLCTDTDAGGIITGLTIGTTYRIRMYTYFTGTTVQNICLSAVVPPANDECTAATAVAVNTGATCTLQTPGTLLGATASAQTNSCNATYDDDDVWFSFVATSTTHSIALNNVNGNNTDLYHSVYTGACGSISGALICSDPNTSTLTGLTVGTTYFIRVYTWGTTTGANTTFSVCVTTPPPPSPGVDCVGATGVCGNASFSGNSNGEGIEEITASNQGCISFSGEQQSSWYFFKPSAGGTLSFTLVTSVDYDFAIWGPYASNSTPSSVCSPSVAPVRCSFAAGGGNTGMGNGASDNSETAAGDKWVSQMNVTTGQVYVMLINNFAADLSSFSLNWGGTATLDCTLLPIELLSFKGKNDGPQNTLEWITASEKNNDYFTLEKSGDGINFEKLADVKGAGNSASALSYNTYDSQPYPITYYRLKQTDYSKAFKYSETISIDRSKDEERISNVYPNPTKDNINFDVFTKSKGNLLVDIINNKGEQVYTSSQIVDEGTNSLVVPMGELRNGVYLLKVTVEKTGKVLIYKVVKD